VNVKPVKKAVSGKSGKTLWLSFTKGDLLGASFHYEQLDKIQVKTISCDDYAISISLEKVYVLEFTVNRHKPKLVRVRGAKNPLRGIRVVTFQSGVVPRGYIAPIKRRVLCKKIC